MSTPPAPSAPERLRHRWEAVPLRARLVGILLGLLVAALAITGWSTQYVLRGYLVDRVDDELTATAARVVRDADRPGGRGGRGGGPGARQPGGLPTDFVLHLTYDDGRAPQLFSSRYREEGAPLPALPQLTSREAAARGEAPFQVGSVDGSLEWRAVAIPVVDAREQGSLTIALPLDGVDDAVEQVRLLALLFGLAVTAACAALGWLAIRRAFVPLTEVEQTAAAIARGDLSRRVPEHPASTEVGRLTSSLNGMLAQIESAFRARQASEHRTRRFAADASHELRTPLAAIRGFAELYRQGAVREPDDVARAMSRIEDEARRMGGLVEDLLLLARLDEQQPTRAGPVDLAVLAGDAVHDSGALAPERTVRLVGVGAAGGPEPTVVTGDENRLRQVLANLLGNAIRHTPAGSPIEVAVGSQEGRAVLEVRDHGPGIPPEHAPKVFERFYRVDSSRARGQGGGSGLGLSIVAAVVTAHRGRVGVAPTPGGGATFRVELPLSAAPAPADAV